MLRVGSCGHISIISCQQKDVEKSLDEVNVPYLQVVKMFCQLHETAFVKLLSIDLLIEAGGNKLIS